MDGAEKKRATIFDTFCPICLQERRVNEFGLNTYLQFKFMEKDYERIGSSTPTVRTREHGACSSLSVIIHRIWVFEGNEYTRVAAIAPYVSNQQITIRKGCRRGQSKDSEKRNQLYDLFGIVAR